MIFDSLMEYNRHIVFGNSNCNKIYVGDYIGE